MICDQTFDSLWQNQNQKKKINFYSEILKRFLLLISLFTVAQFKQTVLVLAKLCSR